jgi:hypothetical protein
MIDIPEAVLVDPDLALPVSVPVPDELCSSTRSVGNMSVDSGEQAVTVEIQIPVAAM